MAIRRIKPNILSTDVEASRGFYRDVLGLEGGGGLDWILFFSAPGAPELQISVMELDRSAGVHPDVSIEADDVEALYEKAVAAGCEIVLPLTDEPWGVRRFFVRDPNGAVINVMQHRED
jgi:catechol 2,3-dioxygenase-like lactoylglutathione lyase family enzyme